MAPVRLFDCRNVTDRDRGIATAIEAVASGDLVVLPTDTVYGVGADAFKAWSVTALLNAKGRGRHMPPPVLVGSRHTLDGLVTRLPQQARDLVEAFWPGALTIVVEQAPSLQWDLGDTGGTVAVRMPLHPVALEVLRATGPMAVSSANLTGEPAAVTAEQAREQLGYKVSVYLEAGPCPDPVPSTIIDMTQEIPIILREGAITIDQIRTVIPNVLPPVGN
ncbi:L-threonylcarbamoyladenylate synthase [Allocatelliglobosispora scoriae]|uniref:L-threonylcarbamoyladenylate synthase n=1 Tax=Allocatelliglobosispora scoriae TaxID=643052 RepID=UPI0035E4054C